MTSGLLCLCCHSSSPEDDIRKLLVVEGLALVGVVCAEKVGKVCIVDCHADLGDGSLERREVYLSAVLEVKKLERFQKELLLILLCCALLGQLLNQLLLKTFTREI